MKNPLCPVCWHRITLSATRNTQTPNYSSNDTMTWYRPYGGAQGQIATRTDGGYWRCEACGVVLTPYEASLMIDAVLRASNQKPDADDHENFLDAITAAWGGGLK